MDRSKAAGKQGELGRNAGGGDKLPPGRAKNYIFLLLPQYITHEIHLFDFFKKLKVLTDLWKLSSALFSASSFEITFHRFDDSSFTWCLSRENAY